MSILETLMKIMNNVSNHTPASVYFWPLFEHFKTLLTTLTNSGMVQVKAAQAGKLDFV